MDDVKQMKALLQGLGDHYLAGQIHLGPTAGEGWMTGRNLADAGCDPLNRLLQTLGERAKTDDRKIIAAAFAARLGWSSVAGILPCLLAGHVPRLPPENTSLKFGAHTLFEATAIHECKWVASSSSRATPPSLLPMEYASEVFCHLSEELHRYSRPIVDALHEWSRFSKRGIWGQIYAGWGSVIHSAVTVVSPSAAALPYIQAFFATPMDDAGMAPEFYALTYQDMTRLFHRRSSCCLFYKLPQGSLCASCPLETDDIRVTRNLDMLARESASTD